MGNSEKVHQETCQLLSIRLPYPGSVIPVPPDTTHFIFVSYSTEFLDELESARKQVSLSQGHAQEFQPVVVHCTAGVGRTGVIILTDLMIACLQSNQVTSLSTKNTGHMVQLALIIWKITIRRYLNLFYFFLSSQRVNILKSLIHLRCQRMLLVANFGQYRFVYTTLIHFLKNSRLIWKYKLLNVISFRAALRSQASWQD